jgi:hypothetical protein
MTTAGCVGIRCGDQDAGRVGNEILQKLLECEDGPRPHPASGRGVQRVAPLALDRCRAQGVDRRLAHRDAGQAAGAADQAEQCLPAARREVAIIRAAYFDSDQTSRAVPVREPGAAVRAFPDDVSRVRGYQDAFRQSPLRSEIEPGR